MISLIYACDSALGIGFKGKLPWPRIHEDMEWFRDKTMNQVVVMGSNTWRSIGSKPLTNRMNYVLSRTDVGSETIYIESLIDVPSRLRDLERKHPDKEIFVIGGAKIYEVSLISAHRIYETYIKKAYEADVFLPANIDAATLSMRSVFHDTIPSSMIEFTGEFPYVAFRPEISFTIYERRF
jgi:dihydrofolate reductase